jgi:hypothetical protein
MNSYGYENMLEERDVEEYFGETLDEFRMFPQLQMRLAKKRGRKPECPCCGQILGVGQMVVMRKVYLPTRSRGQRLVLTCFHLLCWYWSDAQKKADETYMRREAFGRRRCISFLRGESLAEHTKEYF